MAPSIRVPVGVAPTYRSSPRWIASNPVFSKRSSGRVGASAMVGAGSVVSNPVPSFVVVAGNPARFARKLTPVSEQESQSAASLVSVR